MIWTSQILFLDLHTTVGLNLTEFILARSREPVFYTGHGAEKHDRQRVQIVGKPHECLLEAEEFFNRRNQSILDFERIFVGMRNPYDLEIARYLDLLNRRDPGIDPAGNIASRGFFQDFLEYAPLDEYLPPRLERYFEVLGESPGNLRVLRFESFTNDFCENLSPYLSDVESISACTPTPNRYEQVYDARTEELCYRRNRWFFDTGYYPRLSVSSSYRGVTVGPTSILALLSCGRRDVPDSDHAAFAESDGGPLRPSVTIAIAFCDHAEFFRNALASIFRQSFSDWELLLVDNGSTDGCRAMADELAAVDARVRCLNGRVTANAGAADSLALVYQEARGEILAKLGPDCSYVSDDALAQQVALMRDFPQAAMAYGQRRLPAPGTEAVATVPKLQDADRIPSRPQLAAGIIRQWDQISDCRIERLSVTANVGAYEPTLPAVASEFGLLLKLAVRHSAYVSSQCWHQRHSSPAPDFLPGFERSQHAHEMLSAYEWADAYLRMEGAHNRHTRKALGFRIWPFRHPRLWRWRYERWPAFVSALHAWLDSLSPRHHARWRYRATETLRWWSCRTQVSVIRIGRFLAGKTRGNINATAKIFWLNQLLPGQLPAVAVEINWTVKGADQIAITVGGPDGAFVIRSKDAKGSITTAPWVEDRAWFFLQDATAESPHDITATLDVMQVRVRRRAGHRP